MRVLAADSGDIAMQEGALTADGAPHKLHLARQPGRQYAAPMYKLLQATLHTSTHAA